MVKFKAIFRPIKPGYYDGKLGYSSLAYCPLIYSGVQHIFQDLLKLRNNIQYYVIITTYNTFNTKQNFCSNQIWVKERRNLCR